MIRLIALALLLTACSSDKREYHPPAGSGVTDSSYGPASSRSYANQPPPYRPDPQPESGVVMGLSYDSAQSTTGKALAMVGNVGVGAALGFTPFEAGYDTDHVPTYRIRLNGNRVVDVRDPKCPPLIRGSRVTVMPLPNGRCRIIPENRR